VNDLVQTAVTDSDQKRPSRYRVHLSVRYGARDFQDEYVENLSQGGLFIRGAHHLDPHDEVDVELELPGFDKFQITARVAYVLGPSAAKKLGRRPGAGMSIVKSPARFRDALNYYLHRLERRRDFLVFAADPAVRALLEESGYQVRAAPAAAHLAAALRSAPAPVIGIVVTRSQESAYVEAATGAGEPGLVHAIDYLEELDEILARLDLGY
jgi:Tfp pilus assembly protein PilZ